MNVAPVFKHSSKNIAKGTTDPRVEFISEDHSTQFTDILNILQFQNLGNASTQPINSTQPNID